MNVATVLGQPVGAVYRPIDCLVTADSLNRAAAMLRESGLSSLPVQNGMELAGVFGENEIRRALSESADLNDPVAKWLSPAEVVLSPSETAASALRKLEEQRASIAVVVDHTGMPIGVLSASDLASPSELAPRPKMVGGLATPFGVYLTNGGLSAGVPAWGLVAAGMFMFGLFVGADLLATGVDYLLEQTRLTMHWREVINSVVALGGFAFAFRLTPVAGLHAAEHMVVHAIERGEDLQPEIVARMPRVHPRCGTNLAVAMTMFLGIQTSSWNPSPEIRTITAALLTLFFWRSIGSWVQYYVTTKKPTRKQIEAGIRSGNELLAQYQTSDHIHPSPVMRILRSGMLHIMLGSFLAGGLIQLLASVIPGLKWLSLM